MPFVVNKDPDTFRSGFAFWNSQTDVMSLATPSDRKVMFAATLFICVRSSFPLLDFAISSANSICSASSSPSVSHVITVWSS